MSPVTSIILCTEEKTEGDTARNDAQDGGVCGMYRKTPVFLDYVFRDKIYFSSSRDSFETTGYYECIITVNQSEILKKVIHQNALDVHALDPFYSKMDFASLGYHFEGLTLVLF